MISNKIKVVIDDAIPFIGGVLEPFAEVIYKSGKGITRDDVIDADALIVRTRTKCNASLLEGTSVRFIATATIGTDHIDLPYCASKGITVTNAAGCNACGVMDYVFTAAYSVAQRKGICIHGRTLGIIGVGNVGKRVEAMGSKLGFTILRNDPPRQEREGDEGFCSLEYLLENSDIITMHVPLDESTRGMADDEFFSRIRPGTVFINASRGEVVVDSALKNAIEKLGATIIDVWNNEPGIDKDILAKVDVGTPHIAGYSYQGKQNGTSASVRSFANFFGIDSLKDFMPKTESPDLEPVTVSVDGLGQKEIAELFLQLYPIFEDDSNLRSQTEKFEQLRSNYHYRREFYLG